MLKVNSIELTNICNLRCPHCPVGGKIPDKSKISLPVLADGVAYHKGYISMEHFLQALQYVPEWVNLQAHGESLLHPQIFELLAVAKAYGKKTIVNTNGLVITADMAKGMFESGLNAMEVSIHTKKSLVGYKEAFNANEQYGFGALVIANILLVYRDNIKDWISSVGIERKHLEKMRFVNVHKWAEEPPTPEHGKLMASRCHYINNNECVVKWDGKIVSCCFDFEGINTIGDLKDFTQLMHRSDYKLCDGCSPAWVNCSGEFGGYGLSPDEFLSSVAIG